MTNNTEAHEPATALSVDDVFTTILDAINAAHHAGYAAGRYVSNNPLETEENYKAAQDAGNAKAQAMWQALYTYAGAEATR